MLWVGLGNPGPSYLYNRHNVGFMAIDRLAAVYGVGSAHLKKQASVQEAHFPDLPPSLRSATPRVLLVKPQTYMNLSGQAVGELARFYKVPLEKIWVFHDDIDLALGDVRVKQGGGHGGHNGLKSLDAHLGQAYWRVRLGVGRPPHRDAVSAFVLEDFPKSEWPLVEGILDRLPAAVEFLIKGDGAGLAAALKAPALPRGLKDGI